jgi:class 3 adenylate cyclase
MPVPSTSTDVVTGVIVFTDLVGFTEFTALSGDDAALELLAAQSRLVDEVLPADARVVKELGDGLLLYFRDPAEAVQAGLDLQRTFEAESESTGMPLWIRVGMHAGVVRERGRDLVGHDVNVAARIVDVAGAGEVLVSDAVRRDAQPRVPTVEFVELGPVVMKGIPDPIRLWRASCR